MPSNNKIRIWTNLLYESITKMFLLLCELQNFHSVALRKDQFINISKNILSMNILYCILTKWKKICVNSVHVTLVNLTCHMTRGHFMLSRQNAVNIEQYILLNDQLQLFMSHAEQYTMVACRKSAQKERVHLAQCEPVIGPFMGNWNSRNCLQSLSINHPAMIGIQCLAYVKLVIKFVQLELICQGAIQIHLMIEKKYHSKLFNIIYSTSITFMVQNLKGTPWMYVYINIRQTQDVTNFFTLILFLTMYFPKSILASIEKKISKSLCDPSIQVHVYQSYTSHMGNIYTVYMHNKINLINNLIKSVFFWGEGLW